MTAAKKIWKNAYIDEKPHALTKEQRDALPPFKDLPQSEKWKKSVVRCSVGYFQTIGGLMQFFHVCGSGDTWEEAFEKARQMIEEERKRSAPR